MVMARCLSGGMKLSPELSAAAQKLFTAACPGDKTVAGKKAAGAGGADEKASEELVQAILKEAQARKQAEGIEKVLLPMRNKNLALAK